MQGLPRLRPLSLNNWTRRGKVMITLLVMIAVIGLIAYTLITLIPMPQPMRTVIIAVAVLIAIILVVRAFGLDAGIPQLGNP